MNRPRISFVIFLLSASAVLTRADELSAVNLTKTENGLQIACPAGGVELELLAQNVLRVHVCPANKVGRRTQVMDPALAWPRFSGATVHDDKRGATLSSAAMTVSVSLASPLKISISDAKGGWLQAQTGPLEQARNRQVVLEHSFGENLYGMSGLDRVDNGGGLARNNGAEVRAGAQGEGGAPFFFTARYGVLIDSDGGTFFTRDGVVEFDSGSRPDVEYFLILGGPLEVMAGLARLSGRPPLPPKWTLGFLNSQWGADEKEIRELVDRYREKHIPIDAFILDYDWKAWGEDNYGEWRWNSSAGAGNSEPNKFPNGANGGFARDLRAKGIKLAGILKPKILVYRHGSTNELQEAAAYAEANGLWYPGEPPSKEDPMIRNLDFANPETRAWYWKHLEPAFDAGLAGWWNDEADHCYPNWPIGTEIYNFNNFQFPNMGRMLYEGQRGHSELRVWSINRNFYLGAQRYGYAEWSGDIQTGFQSMLAQRARMLATLNLGQPHWSMDTGGFVGHPSPENYARWMEFAAFTPIFRVHGTLGEKRQPWVYGPAAEATAARAIRLRYALMPYIYASERVAADTGVGLVRPLFWMFPEEPWLANETSSWMFGDALLVSPVMESHASQHAVCLPSGTWYDYFHGTRFEGGRVIQYPVDAQTWQDIPLFVREGSIIATMPLQDYTDQHPVSEVTLDVFPNDRPARFQVLRR